MATTTNLYSKFRLTNQRTNQSQEYWRTMNSLAQEITLDAP